MAPTPTGTAFCIDWPRSFRSRAASPSCSEPAQIVKSLIAQVTGTVRWRESVAFMADAGVDSFYEIGAGKVLSGLVKRIADGASGTAIGTPEDVAAFKTARAK